MSEKVSKLKSGKRTFIAWLVIQGIITVIIGIAAFLFVSFSIGRLQYPGTARYVVGCAIGLVLPMCTALSACGVLIFRMLFTNVQTLMDGIEEVADGNFDVTLNEKKAGPFIGVYRNFNKMCAELHDVSVLRNDFTNSYSHEFKTPIVSINGFAKLLLERDVSDEDRQMYLNIIADESLRLAQLADNTILLSRLDSQQIITNRAPYALDEQLRNCVIMLASNWSEKGITFSGELEEIEYNGDQELMQHLWLNLINNAVKFTPERGEVDVSLICSGNNAVVCISDTGIGIDEETRRHIFDKYYRAGSATGLGLGLSIAKRITDMCGGTIEVASMPDEGSTFTVTLPLKP